MIKVITFDLDDTLWAVQPVIDAANQTLYDWFQQHANKYTQAFALDYFAELQKITHERHPERGYSVTAVRQTMIEIGLIQAGYQGDELNRLCKKAFEVFLQARNEVDYFTHALPMIEQLHGDYLLGAISNGNADISRVGLDKYFDFSFNADLVGVGKPAIEIFDAMLNHVNREPQEVLHIGDSLEHDIAGANDAGLHSLWVNLTSQAENKAIIPNIEARCLSEIPQAVEAYQQKLIER